MGVTKLGTAIAFVTLFVLCRNELRGHWILYASIWFFMFAISEVGDVVRTGYSVHRGGAGGRVRGDLCAFVGSGC